jgi:hypothetical protein
MRPIDDPSSLTPDERCSETLQSGRQFSPSTANHLLPPNATPRHPLPSLPRRFRVFVPSSFRGQEERKGRCIGGRQFSRSTAAHLLPPDGTQRQPVPSLRRHFPLFVPFVEKKETPFPPRPFLALEVGPRLPYTYPQCMPANSRHATRSMKEPSEAKRHLGRSPHLSSSHRPCPRRISSCAAARPAHTGTQIGPHRATTRPHGRKETNQR